MNKLQGLLMIFTFCGALLAFVLFLVCIIIANVEYELQTMKRTKR